MKIFSTAFKHNEFIPTRYTCDGADVNPPIVFEGIPDNTKTLALIMDDPDAPGRVFLHWLVWNIDPGTARIPEGEVPSGGVQGTNDFGNRNYGGPCPPSGTHRYFFKLYALNSSLDLNKSANRQSLERAIRKHIIEQAELVGLYKRNK